MDANQVITIISALGGSGVVVALIEFFKNRRKLAAEVRVAEKTTDAQVGLVSVQELEAKLGYLNKVIVVLEQHNIRLEAEVDQQYTLNTTLNARVRELSMRCDRLEMVVRKLCIDNGLDPERYL